MKELPQIEIKLIGPQGSGKSILLGIIYWVLERFNFHTKLSSTEENSIFVFLPEQTASQQIKQQKLLNKIRKL